MIGEGQVINIAILINTIELFKIIIVSIFIVYIYIAVSYIELYNLFNMYVCGS